MNFNVSRGYGSINKKVEERSKKLVNKTILNKKMPVYITTHEDQIEFEKLFKSDPETIKNDVCNIIWYSKD